MISPTTEIGLPFSVLPSMEEVTVVTDHGCSSLGFIPTSPAGASYEPLVGLDQSAKRMPLPLAMATEAARRVTAPIAMMLFPDMITPVEVVCYLAGGPPENSKERDCSRIAYAKPSLACHPPGLRHRA